jgi:hypothetical protein
VMDRKKIWEWAERLYTRYHSMHGLAGSLEAWSKLDEWEQGYWFGVAEFVADHFEEKR